jgi:hypothetical protein
MASINDGFSSYRFIPEDPARTIPLSPFLAPRDQKFGALDEGRSDTPYTYQLIKRGPDVNAAEVELPDVQAVEIMVLWGNNVLSVAHLTPPRSYYIGERDDEKKACDVLIPSEKLGTGRQPLILVEAGLVSLILAAEAKGFIELPGRPRLTVEEAVAGAAPSAELTGAHRIPFPSGAKARIEQGDFVFQIAAVNAGKPVKHGILAGFNSTALSYFGLSFFAHAGLVGSMALFVPPIGLTPDEDVDNDQRYLIQQYLVGAAERERQEREDPLVQDQATDDSEGGTGTQAKNESGSMGNPVSKAQNQRYGIKGPKDNPDPHLSRLELLREAREFGMIGILFTGASVDPNAPRAPWGRATSLGTDDISAQGNMWGASIGEAFGAGGLGLTGIGEGAGGIGEGIGLGNIGGLGHGAGAGTEQGIGHDYGRLGRGHRARAPRIRPEGVTTVSGRLPPEVIQRVVRQNYGRFRMCYERGLGANPNLEGRVAVRFVIGRDGAVSNVSNGGSDLPDPKVVGCVISAYYGLSFPEPDNGIVTVVYPIVFTPG